MLTAGRAHCPANRANRKASQDLIPANPAKWVVLRTAPAKESNAVANAENKLSLESYAPKLKLLHQTKPLFPGYAFARTNPEHWPRLLQLKHVRGLLMAGDHPSWVEDGIIDQIRESESVPNLPFTYRQKLAMLAGPFTHGLFLGLASSSPGNRVRVLFALLGREFEAEVELKSIDTKRGWT